MDGVSGGVPKLSEPDAGHITDLEIIQSPLGKTKEPGAESVPAVELPVHEASALQRPKKAKGSGVVHSKGCRELGDAPRPVSDELKDREGAVHRLSAGATSRRTGKEPSHFHLSHSDT